MVRISIIGSGWLSLPLAQQLTREYNTRVSTTRGDKLVSLRAHGFSADEVVLTPDSPVGPPDFFDCDVLIVSCPPLTQPPGLSRVAMVALMNRICNQPRR